MKRSSQVALLLMGTTAIGSTAYSMMPSGSSYVRKPLYSREGANVALVAGEVFDEQPGPYGTESFIRQQLASLGNFSGQYPVLGSWIVDGASCGLSIREGENPITSNSSRFLPHAII